MQRPAIAKKVLFLARRSGDYFAGQSLVGHHIVFLLSRFHAILCFQTTYNEDMSNRRMKG